MKKKTTILFAGAKKVKQLEARLEKLKGIEEGTTIMYIGKAQYWRKDKVDKYFVSKNKIREKIKELEEIADEDNLEEYAKIDVLEELLEEN